MKEITKYNLEKDEKVLGQEWSSTYGGYFSDKENIQLFIDAVKPVLPERELDMLYVCSASGLLGEELKSALGKGNLTIMDISQKHLDENKDPETEKICADLLEMDLKKKVDLIIMRSSLDYFPSKILQVKALEAIRNHLKENGIFINQPAYISDINDRDLMSQAYNSNEKIGHRFFQSADISSIYEEAGFEVPMKIGDGKIMNLTEKDHIDRYDINEEEIRKIQEILKDAKYNAQVTEKGYSMKFEFPIFMAKQKNEAGLISN